MPVKKNNRKKLQAEKIAAEIKQACKADKWARAPKNAHLNLDKLSFEQIDDMLQGKKPTFC